MQQPRYLPVSIYHKAVSDLTSEETDIIEQFVRDHLQPKPLLPLTICRIQTYDALNDYANYIRILSLKLCAEDEKPTYNVTFTPSGVITSIVQLQWVYPDEINIDSFFEDQSQRIYYGELPYNIECFDFVDHLVYFREDEEQQLLPKPFVYQSLSRILRVDMGFDDDFISYMDYHLDPEHVKIMFERTGIELNVYMLFHQNEYFRIVRVYAQNVTDTAQRYFGMNAEYQILLTDRFPWEDYIYGEFTTHKKRPHYEILHLRSLLEHTYRDIKKKFPAQPASI